MSVTSPAAPPEQPVARAAQRPVSLRTPIIMGVVGVLALGVFLLAVQGGHSSRLLLSESSSAWQLSPLELPSKASAIVLALAAVALAAAAFWFALNRRKVPVAVTAGFGVLIALALIIVSVAGNASGLPLPFMLRIAVTSALPLVFGAIAGLLCERSGIINIAIEGQLLAGAFMATIVGSATDNPFLGLAAAPLAGGLVGLLLALFSIKYRVDQIIVGVVLNVLVLGLTSYLLGTVVSADPANLNSPPAFGRVPIPLLSEIPVIGPALFNQSFFVYSMYVIVALLQVMLFRSRWGLRVRAVGEHPKAADTVGIDVNRTRYRNTVLGSAVAGFGGAAFVLALGLPFTEEVTAGRGYIALAAMILGRWTPTGALGAALLFGLADSLSRVYGNIGSPVPDQLLKMLPYLATILAVAGLIGRIRPPAAEGQPYPK